MTNTTSRTENDMNIIHHPTRPGRNPEVTIDGVRYLAEHTCYSDGHMSVVHRYSAKSGLYAWVGNSQMGDVATVRLVVGVLRAAGRLG